MSSERITSAELERSRRAREIARNWLQAEETRAKLSGLDPEVGDGAPGSPIRPGKSGRSPLDRIKEARISGLEVREFSKGLGDESSSSRAVQVNPSTLVEQRSLIIRSLVAAGRTPEEIQQYMEKVTPYLDVVATAGSDPTTQSLLFSRLMNGGQQASLTIKDVAEVISMLNMAKQPQPQSSDPAAMAGAMVNAVKVGIDAAKSTNNSDPLATIAAIAPLYKEVNEGTRQALQSQIDLLKSQNRDPVQYLQELRGSADALGWGPREPEPTEVTLAKLHSQNAREQRAIEMKREDLKDKRQSEFVKNITSTLSRAFESPIIKEFGRGIGRSIGADKNPVVQAAAKAPAAAAQAQLQNPMEERFSFTCSSCKRTSYFSRAELLKIEQSSQGRWVCPSCGSAYSLKNSSGETSNKKDKDEGPPIG